MRTTNLFWPVIAAFFAGIVFVHACSGSGGDSATGQAEDRVPVGTVLSFAGGTPPAGFLPADGAAVSRATYADLFAAVGTAWGSGNGTSTFNLPDLRGRFLRGVDGGAGFDPDAGARTASAAGGNTGDAVGSVQGGATAFPVTPFITDNPGNHTHPYIRLDNHTTAAGGRSFHRNDGFVTDDGVISGRAAGNHTHAISGGDNETRPVNANVRYIIKF